MRKIEFIEWIDSTSTSEWHNPEEKYTPMMCQTVGFLIAEDGETITLANSQADEGGEDDQVCLTMTIPKPIITKRRALK